MKILFMEFSSQLIILDTIRRCKVSLASNNKLAQVFQAIASLYSPQPSLLMWCSYSYIAIGRDFMSACANGPYPQ